MSDTPTRPSRTAWNDMQRARVRRCLRSHGYRVRNLTNDELSELLVTLVESLWVPDIEPILERMRAAGQTAAAEEFNAVHQWLLTGEPADFVARTRARPGSDGATGPSGEGH